MWFFIRKFKIRRRDTGYHVWILLFFSFSGFVMGMFAGFFMMGQTKGRLDEVDLPYMDVWDFAFLLHACMGHSVLLLLYLGLGQLDLLEVILEAARCARHLSGEATGNKKYFSPLYTLQFDVRASIDLLECICCHTPVPCFGNSPCGRTSFFVPHCAM
ncbi:hypothetical protein DFH27DRAFT_312309 [Peziza echinospora]|nr:hypothetical protein DFH27DRAFT_312309 [Peziza echinospora]